jgi:DNA primase
MSFQKFLNEKSQASQSQQPKQAPGPRSDWDALMNGTKAPAPAAQQPSATQPARKPMTDAEKIEKLAHAMKKSRSVESELLQRVDELERMVANMQAREDMLVKFVKALCGDSDIDHRDLQ